LQALYEYDQTAEFEIVAINDLGAHEASRYLTHGQRSLECFNAPVELDKDQSSMVSG
jgi:glyceraldehyde-3-phosphate dehydrogenase/erythrose-4-phosphate dehydrogenase